MFGCSELQSKNNIVRRAKKLTSVKGSLPVQAGYALQGLQEVIVAPTTGAVLIIE